MKRTNNEVMRTFKENHQVTYLKVKEILNLGAVRSLINCMIGHKPHGTRHENKSNSSE